ncbi:hypothetical protein HOLleu_02904 [Holothuria leucospilota]|uniref:Uncharacterized protein n=1 Tax=Holothuria leucospilota TaxID=206669 RepID=A0A9Q1HL42_HOLLE|nr:hypothetical protein HOLleu_02904 [Holothuria leucospilota]
MFKRKNFNELEETIREITTSDGSEGLKYGLKNELKFLIKKASFLLKADLLVNEEDKAAKELEKIETEFEMRKHDLFADSEYQMLKNRQTKIRKPQEQPLEEDVPNNKEWDACKFSLLRDLAACRLTLFNGRRGGEPCRLTLQEWMDAAEDKWLNPDEIDRIKDPIERELIKKTKIAFQTGKGSNRLVSVLIPQDCIDAVTVLSKPDIRTIGGIPTSNKYLLPFTQQSLDHPSGYYCVNRIANMAGIQDTMKMTATPSKHTFCTA